MLVRDNYKVIIITFLEGMDSDLALHVVSLCYRLILVSRIWILMRWVLVRGSEGKVGGERRVPLLLCSLLLK